MEKQKKQNTMKKTILSTITVIAVMLTSIFVFDGCKKPKDGINGLNGTNGTNGTNGAVGATGATGNANVQTQTLTFNTWSHFGTAGQAGDGYQSTQTCSIITPTIVSTGAVLAYFSASTTQWVALPYTEPNSTWTSHWTYGYLANQFIFQTQDSDFLTVDPSGSPLYVKVVCVASARMGDPNINWSDYNDVKKKLNLPD